MKVLAISNLHARLDELQVLFEKMEAKGKPLQSFDRIIFMGDYIGYGAKTNETIAALMELKEQHKNIVFLKGDWEDTTWKVHCAKEEEQKDAFRFFVQYEQKEVLNTLRSNTALLTKWLRFIEEMPVYHVEGDMIFAHSGVDISRWKKGMTLEHFLENEHSKEDYMWSIYFQKPLISYWANKMISGKEIYEPFPYSFVLGQTPIHKLRQEPKETVYTAPFVIGNTYGIDFGGQYEEGRLGAVVFSEEGMRTYTTEVLPREKEKEPKDITYDLYQKGVSLPDIATKLNVKEITIVNHLLECFKEGRTVELTPFYKQENEAIIVEKAKEIQSGTLKDLKERLPKHIRYAEIKAVLLKNKLA